MTIVCKTRTPQEAFDHVFNFIVKQGRPAINETTRTCKYITDEGLKCAAGCLIDGPLGSISSGTALGLARDGSVNWGTDPHLVAQMQECHDSAAFNPNGNFVSTFTREMRKVAAKFSLKVPE